MSVKREISDLNTGEVHTTRDDQDSQLHLESPTATVMIPEPPRTQIELPLRPHVPNPGPSHATAQVSDDDATESNHVQRATGKEALMDPDLLRVGVRDKTGVLWYICKRDTPLRRVLNAYTAEIGRDPKFCNLKWEHVLLGAKSTTAAEDLGIVDGDQVEAVNAPTNTYIRKIWALTE